MQPIGKNYRPYENVAERERYGDRDRISCDDPKGRPYSTFGPPAASAPQAIRRIFY
jgi:hypothetical protein